MRGNHATDEASRGRDVRLASPLDELSALVFNIQRYSIHDGPGIRTLVFIKGCPLRCKWCSNPEGQKNYSELGFIEIKCVGKDQCQAPCADACPNGAIELSEEGKASIDRKTCESCGTCAQACLYGALRVVGRYMTVDEVLLEVEKDRCFYQESGGGVSLGGGEPLINPGFAVEFLKRCKQRRLHTGLETCGYGQWKELSRILNFVDFVYFDIKHMEARRHREMTGVSNEVILGNAEKILSLKGVETVIRIPVIPGFNDDADQIKAICDFVARCGGEKIELLPYHRYGQAKYSQYGMHYELEDVSPPSEEQIEELQKIVKSFGLKEMTGVL